MRCTFSRAEELMERCIDKFWDDAEGGFLMPMERSSASRFKGIEDIPHPSANSVACILLEKSPP